MIRALLLVSTVFFSSVFYFSALFICLCANHVDLTLEEGEVSYSSFHFAAELMNNRVFPKENVLWKELVAGH